MQKRPADYNGAVSVNEWSHRSPPIRGLSYTFRKSPVAHDCVVVDAVQIEPFSSLHFADLQGDFGKMQGEPMRSLAESPCAVRS